MARIVKMGFLLSLIVLFLIFYRSESAKKRKTRMKVIANLYPMKLMWKFDTLIFKFNKVDIASIDSILFPVCEVYYDKFRNKKLSNQDKEQMKIFLDTFMSDLDNNRYVNVSAYESLSLKKSFFVKYKVKNSNEIKEMVF
jgi:hypothetical protein